MKSARASAEEHWKLMGTRFHGTCVTVPHSASHSATRVGSDFREPRIPTRFFRVRSRWMGEVSRGILWGSGFRDITVDIGIAISGPGRMRISTALMQVRAHWKHWYTKCHLGSSFAKQCSGMIGRHTNSGISKRSEEILIDWRGTFVVLRTVESDWKERSIAPSRISIVFHI